MTPASAKASVLALCFFSKRFAALKRARFTTFQSRRYLSRAGAGPRRAASSIGGCVSNDSNRCCSIIGGSRGSRGPPSAAAPLCTLLVILGERRQAPERDPGFRGGVPEAR